MKIEIPEIVKYITDILKKNGYSAYAVGGCIRDTIMEKTPSDWDICTSSTPQETLECLKKHNVSENGLKHGTVTVVFDHIPYEITTFRVDGQYNDNRHPDSVKFVRNLKEDLARRDFTINAMAYNDSDGLCDYFGGKNDIKNKLIRCVGDPDKRFNEDALRIMRALRFSSVLDFDIESSTSKSIHRNKNLLRNISAERIMSEFSKIIIGKNIAKILTEYVDVFCVFIPEIKPMMGFEQKNKHHIYDVWTHTIKAVEATPPDKVLRFAALFHDIGKPKTFFIDNQGIGHFYGHPEISREIAHNVFRRLKSDKSTMEQVEQLIKYHDVKIIPKSKYVRRAVVKSGSKIFEKLLIIKRADAIAQNPELLPNKLAYIDELEKIYKENFSEVSDFTLKSLDINGYDLMNIGIQPGKEIGICQRKLFKLVVDGEIENKKDILLKEVKQWYNIE